MLELRREHKKGHKNAGVDVLNGKVGDMLKNKVVEPLTVSLHEIQAATEAATMILRIDDVIAAKGGGPAMPPGGPGGPGMPPGGMDEY
jgi:chaperonin GroEL (HSP60 family)